MGIRVEQNHINIKRCLKELDPEDDDEDDWVIWSLIFVVVVVLVLILRQFYFYSCYVEYW